MNLIHNILNIAIVAMIASLIASGCTQDANLAIECSQSWIPPEISKWGILIASVGKIGLNVLRDGFGGLYKHQPPIPK